MNEQTDLNNEQLQGSLGKARFRQLLIRAIVVPILAGVAASALLFWQIENLVAASKWVDHTDQVIGASFSLQKNMLDAEVGVRGFYAGKNEQFLEPYDDAIAKIPGQLHELRNLVSDKPSQLAQLNLLEAQWSDWLTWEQALIEKQRRGQDIFPIYKTLGGKIRMGKIRLTLSRFRSLEEDFRTVRVSQMREAHRSFLVTMIFLFMVLALLVAFFTGRSFRSLSQAYTSSIFELTKRSQLLVESKEWFSTSLSSIGDAVIAVDLESRISFLNPIAEELTGWDADEAIGRPLLDVFNIVNEETRKPAFNPVDKVLKEGIISGLANHTALIGKTGREIPIEDSAAPIKPGAGHAIGVILVFRDVTERHAQQRRLDQANHYQDEFLAILSHELRTPLTSILGWSRELQATNTDVETLGKGLSIIERSAQVQEQLINDLLDISRIRIGKMAIDVRVMDLVSVLNLAVNSVRKLAENKSIAIEMDFTASTCMILADAIRAQQIFWNILTNAIKFTPSGGRIFVKLDIIESPDRMAQVQVSDSGMGIKSEFLPFVFERFSQEDGSLTRRHGGLGLGLALVKNLVDLHDGAVVAESPGEGKGATFTVNLPLVPTDSIPTLAAPTTIESQNAAERLDEVRILVVDDDISNRELFDMMLSSGGAEVRLAESAAEARKILTEFKPDILISDISMPSEDGYRFIRKIRELETEQTGKIPAIALTAYAAADDIKRVLDAGFSAHVAKPVEKATLFQAIAKLVKITDA